MERTYMTFEEQKLENTEKSIAQQIQNYQKKY